jgi:hypothetical protein
MEREPLEPAVLAVELFREETRHRRRSGLLLFVGLGGIAIGVVVAAVAFNAMGKATPATSSPNLVASKPSVKPQGVSQSLYTEPNTGPHSPVGDPKKPETPPKTNTAPPSGSAGTPGTAPFNPLSGAIISRSDVPPDWQPGTEPPPGVEPKAPPKQPPKSGSGATLITARIGGGDPESEAADITSTLQGAGASVRSATHYSLAGGVIGVQIIATCPASAVDSLVAKLGGEKWSGSVEDRAGRVSGMLAGRIRELRAKESELKEKYEEDATEVTVIREEIQKLNQGLAAARSARSPGIAVIVIGIGSL